MTSAPEGRRRRLKNPGQCTVLQTERGKQNHSGTRLMFSFS